MVQKYHYTFNVFVGIDYSGAKFADSPLSGLQVYQSFPQEKVKRISPIPFKNNRVSNWTRAGIADWIESEIKERGPIIVGIDHGFSFPISFFEKYSLTNWHEFLKDFRRYWPTDQPGCSVESVRNGEWWSNGKFKPPGERVGSPSELRLCEKFTSSATSVFRLQGQGTVGKSTHAGLPWLLTLKEKVGNSVHFWPFDGFIPPPNKTIIAEMYPSIFRRRYPRAEESADKHDAFVLASWLQETHEEKLLHKYFDVQLGHERMRIAELEGWILGIL